VADDLFFTVDDKKVRDALTLAIAKQDPELQGALGDIGQHVAKAAKRKAPKGKNHKGGMTLEASIAHRVLRSGVIIRSNKKYAKAQEFGVTTSAHEIIPRKKKALAFNGIVVKKVQHPGGTIKGKHFMSDAVDESTDYVNDRINAALDDSFRGFQGTAS